MRKNKFIGLLAAGALSLTAVALCSIAPVSAYAETTTVESEFVIQEGASVRFATTQETQEGKTVSGIRFAAYITETYYENLTQTVYPTATEIVLQSTVSKLVEAGQTAPAPFTCSWDLTEEIEFNAKGVATFYHTLNFSSLTGENLKAANAFDMEADFWIEVKTESNSDPVKIEADNADTVDTARSMRQVAYIAYTTEEVNEKLNPTYKDERLKNYFSLGASADAVYDMDAANTTILEIAPEDVAVDRAYVLDEQSLTLTDVTDKTLATDTGVFTATDASVGAKKTIVYFDENNVAYTQKTRFVTKIIDNEAELIEAFQWNATKTVTVDPLGYNLLSTDITVSAPLTTNASRTIKYGTLDGDGHKLTVSLAETFGGLFGKQLTNVNIKNMQIDLTRDFGDGSSKANYQVLLAHNADSNTAFTNVEVHIKRADGDTSLTRLYNGKYYVYITAQTNAKAQNLVVYVADGVLKRADDSDGLPCIVQGCNTSSSWYVISPNISKNGTKYQLYASVADAVSGGEKFLSLRQSGYFTLDETNKTLIFGKTNVIYDAATDVTITQTEVTGAEEENITEYKTFRGMAEASYLVPGLNEGIVPQGMDVWEEKDLLFISGYFKQASHNTSGSLSSLILVVDLTTGKHVGTYCIKNQNDAFYTGHMGGIAVTEKNIFIPGSGKSLYRIPLSQVEKVMSAQTGEVKKGTLKVVEQIPIPVGPSWINYTDGVLWVGKWLDPTKDPDTPEWEHMTNNDGETYYAGGVGYKLKDTPSEFSSENWDASTMEYATPDYYLSTTDKVQGFTFVGDKIALSCSQGTGGSHLLVYNNVLKNTPDTSVTLNGKSVPVWFLDGGVQQNDYTILPMSEAVTSYNGKLLVLFESGAKPYNPRNRTDHVWSVTLSN